ncbi:hypothetical protein C8Q72DRAFT_795982 [Fomitopsis betulina]|nr:hypothetical protein C8Q72DRAFT_795982 [Fomitopsis betulina]
MEEIAVAESDTIITKQSFKIRLKQLTIAGLRSILDPGTIAERLRLLAPFLYDFLMAYTAAPNHYWRAAHDRMGRDTGESLQKRADASCEDHRGRRLDLDSALETEGEGVEWNEEFPGFSCNPQVKEAQMFGAGRRHSNDDACSLEWADDHNDLVTACQFCKTVENKALPAACSSTEDAIIPTQSMRDDLCLPVVRLKTVLRDHESPECSSNMVSYVGEVYQGYGLYCRVPGLLA